MFSARGGRWAIFAVRDACDVGSRVANERQRRTQWPSSVSSRGFVVEAVRSRKGRVERWKRGTGSAGSARSSIARRNRVLAPPCGGHAGSPAFHEPRRMSCRLVALWDAGEEAARRLRLVEGDLAARFLVLFADTFFADDRRRRGWRVPVWAEDEEEDEEEEEVLALRLRRFLSTRCT